MAAPHVAGAWAIFYEKNPFHIVDSILDALRTTGVPVTDTRNNIVTPRIQIDAALDTTVNAQNRCFPMTNLSGDCYFISRLGTTTYKVTMTGRARGGGEVLG